MRKYTIKTTFFDSSGKRDFLGYLKFFFYPSDKWFFKSLFFFIQGVVGSRKSRDFLSWESRTVPILGFVFPRSGIFENFVTFNFIPERYAAYHMRNSQDLLGIFYSQSEIFSRYEKNRQKTYFQRFWWKITSKTFTNFRTTNILSKPFWSL